MYAFWKEFHPAIWPDNYLSFFAPHPITKEKREYTLFREETGFPLWEYRRSFDKQQFTTPVDAGDISLDTICPNDACSPQCTLAGHGPQCRIADLAASGGTESNPAKRWYIRKQWKKYERFDKPSVRSVRTSSTACGCTGAGFDSVPPFAARSRFDIVGHDQPACIGERHRVLPSLHEKAYILFQSGEVQKNLNS